MSIKLKCKKIKTKYYNFACIDCASFIFRIQSINRYAYYTRVFLFFNGQYFSFLLVHI